MEVPIVDRSPIDMLLTGDYAAREPKPPRHRYKIRADPSNLPLGYWPNRSQEYRTFNQRKKLTVKLSPPTYKERLPRWVPGFIKWPLESSISSFLGETEQRPLHLGMGVSLPYLWCNRVLLAVGLGFYVMDVVLLAWFRADTLDLQYTILGIVAGVLFGIFLRTRQERVFEWSTFGVMFLLSSIVIVGGMISARQPYGLPIRHYLLEYSLTTIQWLDIFQIPLTILLCWGPFIFDRQSLRLKDDAILLCLLVSTFVYSSNLWVPIGAFAGRFVKIAPEYAPHQHLAHPTTGTAASHVDAHLPAASLGNGSTTRTTTTSSILRGGGLTTTTTATPAVPERRRAAPARAAEEDKDDYLYPKRWMPPITSPYEGYRTSYNGKPSAVSGLMDRASALASGGAGSSLGGGGAGPSAFQTDGRRSIPGSLPPAAAGISGGGGLYAQQPGSVDYYYHQRPADGTPLHSRSLVAAEDDGPPPITSPVPVGQGLYSRRRQSQQSLPAQSQYGSSGASPYGRQSPYPNSTGRKY